MFETFSKILVKLGLFAAILTVLYTIGAAINALVPWQWLTSFFVIMRHFMAMFNWLIDIDTLLTIIGLGFTLKLAVWTYRLSMRVIAYFYPEM